MVGHVVIKRGAEPRVEIIQKQESSDHPQIPRGEGRQQSAKCPLHLRQIETAARFVDQIERAENCRQRGDGDDRRGGMQRRGWCQPLDQLAADNGARHRRDVEPQPLLIDEAVAGMQPLAVLDQNRAAQGARYRHRVGGQQQHQNQRPRRGDPGDPQQGAGSRPDWQGRGRPCGDSRTAARNPRRSRRPA